MMMMMMAACSGTSSPGSSVLQSNSGSEEDLRQVMDQRKRKRMISNRESARRSRMRKQKHLDDLTAQVAQLRKENAQILSYMNASTQRYLNAEAENSILKAQVAELTHRLESLNEIADFLDNPLPPPPDSCGGGFGFPGEQSAYNDGVFLGQNESPPVFNDGFFVNNNSWNFMVANQPIMTPASADILQY
ncbi:hypothetical protein DM860_005980 [Cuscuta australis]|uniref:BZIP domain-containing protein n=2 Tax=Cuscuta sect. Cleistogrammica TaxID=1824901 RepID=A0A328DT68_9ASTE|nr:hypothetical protein DM860_005980 [Cuscuta australis]